MMYNSMFTFVMGACIHSGCVVILCMCVHRCNTILGGSHIHIHMCDSIQWNLSDTIKVS